MTPHNPPQPSNFIPLHLKVSAPSTLPGPSESQASSPSAIPSMEDLLTVIEAGMSPELIDVRSRLDSERNFGVSDQVHVFGLGGMET